MAEASGDFLTDVSERLLCCEICQENFDPKVHLPRILPCHHSFCQQCLDKLNQNGYMTCPLCRKSVSVRGSFPVDITRMALMDMKSVVKSQESMTVCAVCSDNSRALFNCQDCRTSLCNTCCVAHCQANLTKDHTVVPLKDSGESANVILDTTEKCNQHSEKRLKYFCNTCQIAICSSCSFGFHRGHVVIELKKILSEQQKKVLPLGGDLDIICECLQISLELAVASLEALDRSHHSAILDVETTFSSLMAALDARKTRVLETLQTKFLAERSFLEKQLNDLQQLLNDVEPASDAWKQLNSQELSSQTVGMQQNLLTKVEELKNKSRTPVAAAPTIKVDTSTLTELKASLETFGDIKLLVASVTPPCSILGLSIQYPEIQLDARLCGPSCVVDNDNLSLLNSTSQVSQATSRQIMYKFPGTSGTTPLLGARDYWQVRCTAEFNLDIEDPGFLCETGLATRQALQTCGSGGFISLSTSSAMTVVLYTKSNTIYIQAFNRNCRLMDLPLVPSSAEHQLDCTLGFLLNWSTGSLHVFNVESAQELCVGDVDLSAPMWPVLRVWPFHRCHCFVKLTLQTNQHIKLTNAMIMLLRSLAQS